MASLEKEILRRIHQLNQENQQKVLEFVTQLENERHLTALELLKLPLEERQRHVIAAIESASEEEFEIFEAYFDEAECDHYC